MSLNRRSLFLGSMGAALGAGTVLPAFLFGKLSNGAGF